MFYSSSCLVRSKLLHHQNPSVKVEDLRKGKLKLCCVREPQVEVKKKLWDKNFLKMKNSNFYLTDENLTEVQSKSKYCMKKNHLIDKNVEGEKNLWYFVILQ